MKHAVGSFIHVPAWTKVCVGEREEVHPEDEIAIAMYTVTPEGVNRVSWITKDGTWRAADERAVEHVPDETMRRLEKLARALKAS